MTIAFFIAATASSSGNTWLKAKKHGCMMVLIRAPMPSSWATLQASMTKKRSPLATIVSCTERGRRSQTSSGP